MGERAVGARRPDTARVEVWVLQDGPAVVHLRDRNTKCRGEFYDFFGGVLSGPVPHNLVPLIHSLVPRRSERPGDVLREEVVALDHQQEGFELLTGIGIETDPTVGRGLDRGQFSHARRSRYRWTAGECVVQVDESAGTEMAGFHQRTVDDFTAPSFARAKECGHRTYRRVTTQDPFEDAAACLQWGLVLPRPQTHGSALGLQRELCRGLVAIWTGQAER